MVLPTWSECDAESRLAPDIGAAHIIGNQSRPSPVAGPGGDFKEVEMTERFEIGDHVAWNSEAGRVSGTITVIHTSDFDYKGHRRRASQEDPQYEIKSDRTDHIAAHKGAALTRLGGAGSK
jgi:hypothetical protein